MKILIVTDAWRPQLNGVVRTYEYLIPELENMGHEIKVVGPCDFDNRFAVPGYKEIELAIAPYGKLSRIIEEYRPDTIHIATEATLGKAAAKYCKKKGWPFTTCYHTHFPDYISKRVAQFLPFLKQPVKKLAIKIIRDFHARSQALFIATQSLEDELKSWGFTTPMKRLTRGVNLDIFYPGHVEILPELKSPVALYVGRIAIEKNLEAFLKMDWDGSMLIVGHGPDLEKLQKAYPHAVFVGKKIGKELGDHFRRADVYVFPSKTDTFGMVLTEAMCCGLPLAGYDVTGPKDIITEDFLGAVGDDLATAAKKAATLTGYEEKRFAYTKEHYTWEKAAQQFMAVQEKALCTYAEETAAIAAVAE